MRYFFACTMLLSVMWGCGDSQSPLPSTNANTQMQPNTTRPDPNKPEQTQNNTSSKASTSNRSSTSQNIPQTTQTNHATQTNHTTQNYPIPFQDVPLSHPASMEIHNLYQLNLVQGIGKRRFRPHNNLTRAQFARLLQATFFPETEKNPPQKTLPFEDVPESHWAYSAVLSVYHGGYMSGFSATQFGPDQAMTREQALAALAKFLKLSGIPSTGFVEREFSDADQLSSWAQIPAFRALLHGLLGNHVLLLYRGSSKTSPPQRLLRPKEAVLRAEAASFMFFAYILQVEWGTPQNDDLLPGSSYKPQGEASILYCSRGNLFASPRAMREFEMASDALGPHLNVQELSKDYTKTLTPFVNIWAKADEERLGIAIDGAGNCFHPLVTLAFAFWQRAQQDPNKKDQVLAHSLQQFIKTQMPTLYLRNR